MPMTSRFRPDKPPRIPYNGLIGRENAPYIADPKLIDAANVALALEMPLLLTGEPGCGKSEFAHVVANALAAPDAGALLECHIRSDSRARDLLYQYDAVLRFADSHHGRAERAADARHYLELQALGVALTSPTRRVVLIDEIDKAPRDLPNDLLRELDRGEFEIPEIPAGAQAAAGAVLDRSGVPLARVMKRPKQDISGRHVPKPMIVITSNVERQLPEPFLRRCVFYHIDFPEQQLLEIARAHFPDYEPPFIEQAVMIFRHARNIPDLIKKPSTAELLSWIHALALFEPDHAQAVMEDLDLDERSVTRGEQRWIDLPAIGCLFKLYEDWKRAGEWHAGAKPAVQQ